MLQFINNHRKSFVGLFGVVIMAFIMTGFGVDLGSKNTQQSAIVVNDTQIQADEYYEERRAIESRMRMFMGDRLDAILPSLDLGQQAVDTLISRTLIQQYAHSTGMRASDSEVQDALLNSGLFRNGFDPEIYRNYLLQIGKTATHFEAELQEEALVRQFTSLLRDAGRLSNAELRAVIEQNETEYSVAKVEIDPHSVITEVLEPGRETLSKFFESNASDYETAAAVLYNYLVLDPADFLDAVEVLPEDVEAYYLDHESKFAEPESIKARHIQFTFEADRDPKKMAELKEKAQKAREEALSGKPFEELVKQYSDDFATRDQGGDLGWFSKGKMDPALEKAAFAVKEGGFSELVEADYGYHIVLVESYKPSRTKELDEVRAEIESIIRKEEAPAYTAARAEELFEKWRKSGATLSEFSVQEGLTAASTHGVKKAGEDPQGLAGLTKKVLEHESEQKQMFDLGEKSILVLISEYRPPDIPLLDEVKDKVLAKYKEQEAKILARKKGDGILETLAKGVYGTFDDAVKAANLITAVEKGVKRTGSSPGVFASKDVRDAIFSTHKSNTRIDKLFEAGGKFYLFEVREITPPKSEDVDKKVKELRTVENNQAGQMLVSSVVNALKARAEISISPDLPIAQ